MSISRYMVPANKLSQEHVIKQFKEKHKDKFDYSKVDYKSSTEKVIIICKKHGEFLQLPHVHKRGAGCRKCADNLTSSRQLGGLETYIKRLYRVQPKEFVDNIDFSEVNFVDQHTIIKNIKCKRSNHTFDANPCQLPLGHCCLKCSDTIRIKKYSENFFKNARKIHGLKYDYSKSVYIDSRTPLIIICPYHGDFSQRPQGHATDRGAGNHCPSCKSSKGEELIEMWAKQNNIKHVYQYKIKINNSRYWFDFYFPEFNLMIEFQGRQHYETIPFWDKGDSNALKTRKQRDKLKKEYCKIHNINFLDIHYSQIDKIDKILTKITTKLKCNMLSNP